MSCNIRRRWPGHKPLASAPGGFARNALASSTMKSKLGRLLRLTVVGTVPEWEGAKMNADVKP